MQSRVVASAWPRSRSTGRMHTLRLTQSRSLSFTEARSTSVLRSRTAGRLIADPLQTLMRCNSRSRCSQRSRPALSATYQILYHVVSSNALTGAGVGAGTLLLNQAHVFRDFRTGVVDIPMANSGFGIGLVIAYIDGGWQLTASKAGAAVLANGFSSGAGTVTPNTAAPNLITVTVQQ
jgi:hypothetical protein